MLTERTFYGVPDSVDAKVVNSDFTDCVIEWQIDGYAANVLSYTVRLILFQIQIKSFVILAVIRKACNEFAITTSASLARATQLLSKAFRISGAPLTTLHQI